MARKSSFSPQFKEMIVKEYLEGNISYRSLASKYNVAFRTIEQWVDKYKLHGISALYPRINNSSYTKEFKLMCVKEVIDDFRSVAEVVAKYNISSRSVLLRWIKCYNANRELKDYFPKREVYMAEARRRTTLEERKEIVEYCLSHNRNYKETASLFEVSYNQVYSWVKKYDTNGVEGLSDKRGIHKPDNEVDELERLKRENLRLQRQLKEKDMLVELLKKMKDFERM